jgi:hypothetical protein
MPAATGRGQANASLELVGRMVEVANRDDQVVDTEQHPSSLAPVRAVALYAPFERRSSGGVHPALRNTIVASCRDSLVDLPERRGAAGPTSANLAETAKLVERVRERDVGRCCL